MAPPDRDPDPHHAAAIGLDSAFHHQGEIAAWVEWLLHPEQHPHDRMIILPDGVKVEHPGNLEVEGNESDPNGPLMPDPEKPVEFYPYESVIQGCYTEQFFDPAQALSGQLLDEDSDLCQVYSGLTDTFWSNDDWNGRLIGGFEDLRNSGQWRGDASLRAGEYLGAIDDFMNDFTQIAKEVSAIPLAYAGIITTARRNLNEAMFQLVNAFNHNFYTRESPMVKVLVKGLIAITGAALTYVSGGTAAAAWGAGLATVCDKALDSDGGDVGGRTWREIVEQFFVAQMKILTEAQAEIEKLKQDVVRLAGRMAEMPKLPA
jgi:hypothetical protein